VATPATGAGRVDGAWLVQALEGLFDVEARIARPSRCHELACRGSGSSLRHVPSSDEPKLSEYPVLSATGI